MVKCIAIDDEPLALRQIKRYIERSEQLELVATCRSAAEAQRIVVNREDCIRLFEEYSKNSREIY